MSQENDSLLGMLRREPEQTRLILKIGLSVPVAIVLWDTLGRTLLPVLPVVLVTMFAILIYAGVLTALIARLVHSADKWQVDSAMQTRRLLSGDSRRRSADGTAGGPAAIAPAAVVQTNYHQAYFLLRLTEEVQRARREGSEMCVLALDVTVPGHELTQADIEKVSFEMANLASSQAKSISYSLSTGPTEFVFSLPTFGKAAGKDFCSKLVQALGNYWCHFGLAVYPENATDAESMFSFARQRCEESRQDRGEDQSRASFMVESA
jgi:hypothetical protein